MHDVQAVEELIGSLLEAEPDGVAEVRIRAGRLRSPESLELAFRILSHDTALDGSRLVIERREGSPACPSCGEAVSAEDLFGHVLLCPSCQAVSPVDAEAIELVGVTPRAHEPGSGPSALPC